jgi:hypothetical protein
MVKYEASSAMTIMNVSNMGDSNGSIAPGESARWRHDRKAGMTTIGYGHDPGDTATNGVRYQAITGAGGVGLTGGADWVTRRRTSGLVKVSAELSSGRGRRCTVQEASQHIKAADSASAPVEFEREKRGPRRHVRRFDRRLLHRFPLPHSPILSTLQG